MKTIFAILLIITLIIPASVSLAQEKENSPDVSEQLTSNYFDFYLINGYAIAYKFTASEKSAYRIQLDFSSNYTDGDIKNHNRYTNSSAEIINQNTNGHVKSRNTNVNFIIQYLLNVYSSAKGHIYAGAGPFLSYHKNSGEMNESNIDYNIPLAVYNNNSNSTRTIGAGIAITLGVEGYISDNISLFFETQLNTGKSWTKEEFSSTSIDNSSNSLHGTYSTGGRDTNNWYYNFIDLRFGVGISI